MTFYSALKSGKPAKINKTISYTDPRMVFGDQECVIKPNTWIDLDWALKCGAVTRELALSKDWKIKK